MTTATRTRVPGDAARTTVRGIGELLLTAGLVLLLFCVYQLVWTNVLAHRATAHVADTIRDDWRHGGGTGGTGGSGAAVGSDTGPIRPGQGFAFLHVPRLGRHWSAPIVQGVDLPDLAKGVGHYPRTALPGDVGNFAVAGHRATNGEPFAHLDEVGRGDRLVVETRGTWYTYVVDSTRIVAPTATWVLDPVPGHPDRSPTRPLITLTTCNPRWASYQRLIVFGHLLDQQPRSDGPPSALTRTS